jgi:hypothetical protein
MERSFWRKEIKEYYTSDGNQFVNKTCFLINLETAAIS